MKLFAEKILLADGWQHNKTLVIENGVINQVIDGKALDAQVVKGPVIPGMINCHSHAFQRAFAGFSEQGSEGKDSFWTWRNVMYKFLAQLSAENAETIATQLYIEMVKSGYTRVAEFHYLHHDVSGQPYQELATMAKAIFNAAKTTNIGLTMLPVMYQFSGFGAQAPNEGQQRFINSTEQFNQLVSDCFALTKDYSNTNVGIAPHSLRAVDKQGIEQAVAHVRSLDANAPIHIHIAEQQKEVNDCLAHYGKRPVQWLLDNCQLDKNWCLIHATHIDDSELHSMVAQQAIAGICPTTEANLGDGIFPTDDFLQAGGVMAIGSDSHISVNPIEELRWLEYAQRLAKQQRALLATSETPSVGLNLWQQANKGGALSTNSNSGELAVGKQADLVVLDQNDLALYAHDEQHLLDSAIFATQRSPVRDVMVNGQWVVEDRIHRYEQQSQQAFAELLANLSEN